MKIKQRLEGGRYTGTLEVEQGDLIGLKEACVVLFGSIAGETIYKRSISSFSWSDTVTVRSGPLTTFHSNRNKGDKGAQGPRKLWLTMWNLRFQITIKDRLL